MAMCIQRTISLQLKMLLLVALLLLQASHPSGAVTQQDRNAPATDSTAGSTTSGRSTGGAASSRKRHNSTVLTNSVWMVELNQAPAVSYSGGIAGLAATAVQPLTTAAAMAMTAAAASDSDGNPAAAAAAADVPQHMRFNAVSEAAVQYASYISAQSDATVARTLGASYTAKIRHRYNAVIAGFTIGPLTRAEVAALRQDSSVKSVTRDSRGWVKTIWTPAYLGMSVPNGAWSQLPGRL